MFDEESQIDKDSAKMLKAFKKIKSLADDFLHRDLANKIDETTTVLTLDNNLIYIDKEENKIKCYGLNS